MINGNLHSQCETTLSRKANKLGRSAAWSTCFVLTSCLLVLTGCPDTTDPGSGDGGDGDVGAPTTTSVGVISFRNNFEISLLESPVSVLYDAIIEPETATADIRGFYEPVADASPDASPIGDRVIVAENLPSGTNRAFDFDPSVVGVGFYRVGVIVTVEETETVATSEGIVQVQGPPDPRFILPSADPTQASPGAEVLISFDAGDPEGVVQWRVFYLSDGESITSGTADEFGTQLRVGSGNVGSLSFATAGLAEGNYQLGLSATDSGLSISGTVANGIEDRIVTILGPTIELTQTRTEQPPLLSFTSPGNSDIDVFGDAIIEIEFATEIREPNATGLVEIFYDTNSIATDGNTPIATDLDESATLLQLDTRDLPGDGVYFIGGSVRDGVNSPVTAYAGGRINLVRTGTLDITAPVNSASLKPVAAGDTEPFVTISWITNVPEGEALVDVVAQPVGTGTNQEFVILDDAETSITSATFTPSVVDNTSGLYEIFVRINFNENSSLDDIVASAPAFLRVSGLPTVLWIDEIGDTFDGAAFRGIQPEDNAGSSFATVGVDGLIASGVVIGARYGKPFFVNPSGIGPGEAYLVGQFATERLDGSFSLNQVGTDSLPGLTFSGIRTPENDDTTDGLASILSIPDQDGDGTSELAFGFPFANSRGHNASPDQDGVVNPLALSTLERPGQFTRGGVVIVSSTNLNTNLAGFGNSALGCAQSIDTDEQSTIPLDLVGQNFEDLCVNQLAGDGGNWAEDTRSDFDDDPPCTGSCVDDNAGGPSDANGVIDYGFLTPLSTDYFTSYVYPAALFDGFFNPACDGLADFVNNNCFFSTANVLTMEYCQAQRAVCQPRSPGLTAQNENISIDGDTFTANYVMEYYRSGFYSSEPCWPFGARIIGVGEDDGFGTSMTVVDGDLVVTSPGRSARGLELGADSLGEIVGLGTDTRSSSGVGYLFEARDLWSADQALLPPRPHQYIVGEPSHCPGEGAIGQADNVTATRIAGNTNDAISIITTVPDFNGDTRADIAVGAPTANGGRGRVYVAFRRDPTIENDFVLEKLAFDIGDSERLAGALFVASDEDSFGFSLTSDVDFNRDGITDLVIGSPTADGGTGAVIIVFGGSDLSTGQNGITVEELLALRRDDGSPFAIRITGSSFETAGQFGFNVASAGDVDGDGRNDLLIAAPFASPRYDPNVSDATDELSDIGVDTNLDGIPDNREDLTGAGVVYVISGASPLGDIAPQSGSGIFSISIDELGGPDLAGYIIAGRAQGDRLGGGDAGDAQEGLNTKMGRGRSFGLATAGDVDGDGRDDILIGSILADPGNLRNAGEAYLIYGTVDP